MATTLDLASGNTESCSAKVLTALSSSERSDPLPKPTPRNNRPTALAPASSAKAGLLVRSSALMTSTARSREVMACT